MFSTDLAIATMTLARNEPEAARLKEALTVLSATGIPVHVADGGSPSEFLEWLAQQPNVFLQEARGGLVAQVRASLGAARAAEWVLYTEPDKTEFFLEGLAGLLAQRSTPGGARLIVAARDRASFATFPQGQQIVESCFNLLAAQLLGTALSDTLYGPLLLHRSLLVDLNSLPDDAGWGWRILMYAQAISGKIPVTVHEGSFACPLEQRSEDDGPSRAYRLKQLQQNVKALQQVLERPAQMGESGAAAVDDGHNVEPHAVP